MTNKWKELVGILGGTALTGVQAGWTVMITSAATKIPGIGIPTAILFGVTGTGTTLYLANGIKLIYKDWYNKYY